MDKETMIRILGEESCDLMAEILGDKEKLEAALNWAQFCNGEQIRGSLAGLRNVICSYIYHGYMNPSYANWLSYQKYVSDIEERRKGLIELGRHNIQIAKRIAGIEEAEVLLLSPYVFELSILINTDEVYPVAIRHIYREHDARFIEDFTLLAFEDVEMFDEYIAESQEFYS